MFIEIANAFLAHIERDTESADVKRRFLHTLTRYKLLLLQADITLSDVEKSLAFQKFLSDCLSRPLKGDLSEYVEMIDLAYKKYPYDRELCDYRNFAVDVALPEAFYQCVPGSQFKFIAREYRQNFEAMLKRFYCDDVLKHGRPMDFTRLPRHYREELETVRVQYQRASAGDLPTPTKRKFAADYPREIGPFMQSMYGSSADAQVLVSPARHENDLARGARAWHDLRERCQQYRLHAFAAVIGLVMPQTQANILNTLLYEIQNDLMDQYGLCFFDVPSEKRLLGCVHSNEELYLRRTHSFRLKLDLTRIQLQDDVEKRRRLARALRTTESRVLDVLIKTLRWNDESEWSLYPVLELRGAMDLKASGHHSLVSIRPALSAQPLTAIMSAILDDYRQHHFVVEEREVVLSVPTPKTDRSQRTRRADDVVATPAGNAAPPVASPGCRPRRLSFGAPSAPVPSIAPAGASVVSASPAQALQREWRNRGRDRSPLESPEPRTGLTPQTRGLSLSGVRAASDALSAEKSSPKRVAR